MILALIIETRRPKGSKAGDRESLYTLYNEDRSFSRKSSLTNNLG